MTVRLGADGAIVLEGACPSDDAEPLLQLLLRHPSACVDWRGCEHVHTAVLQVVLAARRDIVGQPLDRFLRDWGSNILSRGG